jgi:hypothetical protein
MPAATAAAVVQHQTNMKQTSLFVCSTNGKEHRVSAVLSCGKSLQLTANDYQLTNCRFRANASTAWFSVSIRSSRFENLSSRDAVLTILAMSLNVAVRSAKRNVSTTSTMPVSTSTAFGRGSVVVGAFGI